MKPIYALKMRHVEKALECGQSLAAFNGPEITEGVGGGQSGGRYRCKQIGSWTKAQDSLKQGNSNLEREGEEGAREGLRCPTP